MEVRIPRGISVGTSRRARLSMIMRYADPIANVAGIRIRWSGPTSIRQIWGITRPTHPIIPQVETAAAESKNHFIGRTLHAGYLRRPVRDFYPPARHIDYFPGPGLRAFHDEARIISGDKV